MDEKKTNYNRSEILSGPDSKDPLNGAMGVFEGFAEKVRIRSVKIREELKTVTEYELTTIIPDSTVKHFFGEECLNEKHTLKIKAAYWGDKAAEAARKFTPEKSQIIRVFIKNMKTESWAGKDGVKRYTVCGTGSHMGIVHHMSKPKKETEESFCILEDDSDKKTAVDASCECPVTKTGEEPWKTYNADNEESPWD